MGLKTVLVRVLLNYADSTPAFNVKVDATLSRYELDGNIVVPTKITGRTNLSGEVLLSLWPNARGSGASSYRIEASHGKTFLDVNIVVPDTIDGLPIAIRDIVNAAPFPALDASQQALIVVQAAVVNASAKAVLADASAVKADASAVQSAAFAQASANAFPGVAAAYVTSINNIQELRTLFLNYIASHP